MVRELWTRDQRVFGSLESSAGREKQRVFQSGFLKNDFAKQSFGLLAKKQIIMQQMTVRLQSQNFSDTVMRKTNTTDQRGSQQFVYWVGLKNTLLANFWVGSNLHFLVKPINIVLLLHIFSRITVCTHIVTVASFMCKAFIDDLFFYKRCFSASSIQTSKEWQVSTIY